MVVRRSVTWYRKKGGWFGFGLVLAVLPGASTRHEQISWCWNISALVKQVCIADQFVELVFSLLQPQKPPVGFEPGTSCFVIHYNPCNYTRTAGEPPLFWWWKKYLSYVFFYKFEYILFSKKILKKNRKKCVWPDPRHLSKNLLTIQIWLIIFKQWRERLNVGLWLWPFASVSKAKTKKNQRIAKIVNRNWP